MSQISVLLLTFNEEHNLPRCLNALSWCNDIVVVDSFSSDQSVAVATSRGARVFQRKFDNFAAQRNYALREIEFSNPWVLHLDADEVCTQTLKDEIDSSIQQPDFDAYKIPSKMMFMGKWLRYSGMYPTYQVRLGRLKSLRFKQVGHGQREDMPSDRIGVLKQPYVHYSFSKGTADWFEKHNRYSSDEARQAIKTKNEPIALGDLFGWNSTSRRRALKAISYRLPLRSTFRFLYMYVLRLGFLDGRAGYHYCRMIAVYETMTDIKIVEQQQGL